MNEQYLQSIKERVKNATLGDWIVKDSKVVQDWYLPNSLIVVSGENGEEADYEFIREEDAEFIAHARQDVPALIAELERLKNVNKAITLGLDKQKAFESMFKQQLIKNQKLGEALMYYSNMKHIELCHKSDLKDYGYVDLDKGERARKALDGDSK